MTVKQKVKSKRQVAKAIKRLDPEEAEEILKQAQDKVDLTVEDSKERIPGKVVHGQKTTWTRADLDKEYGVCEFTPEKTIPVTVHGVRYQLVAGWTIKAPTIVRDIYTNHLKELRQRVTLPDMGYGVIVDAGAGALPPEK